MLHIPSKLLIFAPSFRKEWRHRGEQLSFDPSENLENSMYKGEKSDWCFSCGSIVTACSAMEPTHLYTYRCEPIFILTYTGIPGPSD